MENLPLLGFITALVLGVAGILYRIRVDAQSEAKAAMDLAAEAMDKAHAVELAVAKEYVALPALHESTNNLLREMQTGFHHLEARIEALAKQARGIARGDPQ